MLTIRLARSGAKKRPFYHISVADSRMPRDGRFVEKIGLFNPYFHPWVFDLWIDKNWQELNKPRQKEAIKKYFPELDKFKIKPHTNLQLGDSKIAQRVGNAVISKYKPNAKSPVGIYNRIAKGIYA